MHIQHSPNHGANEHQRRPKVVDVDIKILQKVLAVSKHCNVIRGNPGKFGNTSHLR